MELKSSLRCPINGGRSSLSNHFPTHVNDNFSSYSYEKFTPLKECRLHLIHPVCNISFLLIRVHSSVQDFIRATEILFIFGFQISDIPEILDK